MLLTPSFAFVHVPKTGGSFVRKILRDHMEVRDLGEHVSRRELRGSDAELPALAFVRDPWEWYVSYYEYVRARSERSPDFRALGFQHDFPTFLRRCFDGEGVGWQVGEWMRNHDLDLYTAMFRWLVGPQDDRLWINRFESFRRDLAASLYYLRAPRKAVDAVWGHLPLNTALPRNLSDYYTPELAEMVGQTFMARRFGYSSSLVVA